MLRLFFTLLILEGHGAAVIYIAPISSSPSSRDSMTSFFRGCIIT